QAEDGIRDRNVTGVQTCALPIYPRNFGRPRRIITVSLSRMAEDDTSPSQQPLTGAPTKPRMVVPDVARGLALLGIAIANLPTARSEERRVGKECRYGWARRRDKA